MFEASKTCRGIETKVSIDDTGDIVILADRYVYYNSDEGMEISAPKVKINDDWATPEQARQIAIMLCTAADVAEQTEGAHTHAP